MKSLLNLPSSIAMCDCCTDCDATQDYQCNCGHCVPRRYRCDGRIQCRDSSDESNCNRGRITVYTAILLGPFHGAIVVPSVTRCRRCRRRRRGHRCAGGVRQWRRATVVTPSEWQCTTARSGEWAQHFSNASCFLITCYFSTPVC